MARTGGNRLARVMAGSAGRASSVRSKAKSASPRRNASRGVSAASGVDSNEEDDDSSVWRLRMGVWGVIDRAANWVVGSMGKI
jgi:hypothetical protein